METAAEHVLVTSHGGYTTNIPLADLVGEKACNGYGGSDLVPENGGPARLLVPHLYLWKVAKLVRDGELRQSDVPGFWESAGDQNYGDPWRDQQYKGD
ncbi:molybdopterin-dependent oxidoreductase [Streptomyces sp. HUAS 31]|uniref:molybdopterin-dependent oxidoreductase n=1 Tax=Streptomyces sp. HUAS 31 TaxID=3020055 RepID=UPI003FA7D380